MSLDINIFSDIYGFSYWLWSPGWIVLMLIQIRMISQRRAFRDSLFMDCASTHPEKVSTATLSGYLRFLAIGVFKWSLFFSAGWGRFLCVESPSGEIWQQSELRFKTLGERTLSPFLGFSGAPSVGLKHSGGLLNYSGEKLQGKVYQKINLLIPYYQFYLGLLWGKRCHNPRKPLGLFLQSVPFFLPQERLSSFIVFLI